MCIPNCFWVCFNSVFFINQVTNVLTEVVPFCKSGHKFLNVNLMKTSKNSTN